jgi:hypothetical protein
MREWLQKHKYSRKVFDFWELLRKPLSSHSLSMRLVSCVKSAVACLGSVRAAVCGMTSRNRLHIGVLWRASKIWVGSEYTMVAIAANRCEQFHIFCGGNFFVLKLGTGALLQSVATWLC